MEAAIERSWHFPDYPFDPHYLDLEGFIGGIDRR
jgi:hypothetical protein